MSFYLWSMRRASVILFVMAVLVLAASLAGNLLVFMQAESSQYNSQPDFQFIQMLLSLASALQTAAFPLFGAAMLWRADRWLTTQGVAK